MRFIAHKVRCVTNERTGAKGWIFYSQDKRAYLSSSKLHEMIDDLAVISLERMSAHENRSFETPVELYCVKGRNQLLVHRFLDASGIDGVMKQSRLM